MNRFSMVSSPREHTLTHLEDGCLYIVRQKFCASLTASSKSWVGSGAHHTRKQAARFRGGTSLRMAWHDRQNRETTGVQKAGRDCACNPLRGGRRAQPGQRRVSAGESKTGRRDLYHWIRVRVGRSAQWASELAVRRLQMLDDVAQALLHGQRLASRFLPTVGDERASEGPGMLDRSATGQHSSRAHAGPASGWQGEAAGAACWTSQPSVFASSPPPGQGEISRKLLAISAGPDLENLILVSKYPGHRNDNLGSRYKHLRPWNIT